LEFKLNSKLFIQAFILLHF